MNNAASNPGVTAARMVLGIKDCNLDAAIDALLESDGPHVVAMALAAMVANRVSPDEAADLAAAWIDHVADDTEAGQ